jgi:hypothetical protein
VHSCTDCIALLSYILFHIHSYSYSSSSIFSHLISSHLILILILIFCPISYSSSTRYPPQGLISYGEFRRVFQASEEDMESRGGDASNIEFIPPKQITEIAEQYSVSTSSYLYWLFLAVRTYLAPYSHL